MSHTTTTEEPRHAKLHTKGAIVLDIILSCIFFYCMFGVIKNHVPSDVPQTINLLSGYTTFCLTLFFWLSVQCFRVTLVDQLRNKS